MICRSKLSLILFLASLAMQSYGFIWIPIPGTKEQPWQGHDSNKIDAIDKKRGENVGLTFKEELELLCAKKTISCTVVEKIEKIANRRYTDKLKLRENDGLFVRNVFVLFWRNESSIFHHFSTDDIYRQKVLTPLASGLVIGVLAAVGVAYFWFTK